MARWECSERMCATQVPGQAQPTGPQAHLDPTLQVLGMCVVWWRGGRAGGNALGQRRRAAGPGSA